MGAILLFGCILWSVVMFAPHTVLFKESLGHPIQWNILRSQLPSHFLNSRVPLVHWLSIIRFTIFAFYFSDCRESLLSTPCFSL